MVRVEGRDLPWREGMTVSDLLADLGDSYPYAVVRMKGRLISRPDFQSARVPDNSEIFLIPLISGG